MGRVNRSRGTGRIRFTQPATPLFPERTDHNLIQWPTEQKIHEVSKRLARISEKGIRWEANGDYFNSGDLAYQLQEIIRATAELFKKCQRIKR
jgi:hypothetical protein